MAPVKIRWTIVCSPVELIAGNGEQLVNRAAGIVVIRLSVRVSSQKLQAATEAFSNTELQRVVIRIGARLHLLNPARDILLGRKCSSQRRGKHVGSTIVN